MFTDGNAPEHAPWQPDGPWESDRIWLRGLDLFDQRYFWECHEAFGWTWNEIKNVTEVGVHHSFISQTEKDKLLQEIGSWYEENTLRN